MTTAAQAAWGWSLFHEYLDSQRADHGILVGFTAVGGNWAEPDTPRQPDTRVRQWATDAAVAGIAVLSDPPRNMAPMREPRHEVHVGVHLAVCTCGWEYERTTYGGTPPAKKASEHLDIVTDTKGVDR